MAYEKQQWKTGDVVTSAKLNHMEDGIAEAGGTPMVSVTHADLLALRNAGTLTPGMQYRITDYVCTTTQDESRSVSHPFDIIVTADSADTLNENARACLHDGDTYYTAEGHSANLEAWELKYCIDNDRNRFGWADETNGKGVIFWMKDERGNECPYDFKQIQFKRYPITECSVANLVGKFTALEHADAITAIDEANPVWAYTFSFYDSEAETPTYEDGSVAVMDENTGCSVYGNVIECYRNYADMTEYMGPFIPYLNNIVFTNTFGGGCYSNTFRDGCNSNTFGDDCDTNTFGDDCNTNTFGGGCYSNTFGNNCYSNTFGDNCEFVDIASGTQGAPKQYFNVLSGTSGTESSHITVPGTGGNNYVTYVGNNSSGTLKTWVPADAVQ